MPARPSSPSATSADPLLRVISLMPSSTRAAVPASTSGCTVSASKPRITCTTASTSLRFSGAVQDHVQRLGGDPGEGFAGAGRRQCEAVAQQPGEPGACEVAGGADVLEPAGDRRHVRQRLVDVDDQHLRAAPADSSRCSRIPSVDHVSIVLRLVSGGVVPGTGLPAFSMPRRPLGADASACRERHERHGAAQHDQRVATYPRAPLG